jgi:hypothetical protein
VPPVVAQAVEQDTGQGHHAVLAALGGVDVQEHALGIDVADTQADDLGDTQSCGVGGLQQQAVTRVADGGEQASDLVGAEDRGQGPGLLAVGEGDDNIGAAEGEAVEQAQGADGLVVAAPGSLVLEQVQLVEAGVFGSEAFGGAAEVGGEACDSRYITGDGAWGVRLGRAVRPETPQPAAQPAAAVDLVADLVAILGETKSKDTYLFVVMALGHMGTEARPAVGAKTRSRTSSPQRSKAAR